MEQSPILPRSASFPCALQAYSHLTANFEMFTLSSPTHLPSSRQPGSATEHESKTTAGINWTVDSLYIPKLSDLVMEAKAFQQDVIELDLEEIK